MRRKYIVLAGMVFSVMLFGCGGAQEQQGASSETSQESDSDAGEVAEASRDIFAMDTYMMITAFGDQAEEAVEASDQEIRRLDALLSTGIESSEISQINLNGGGSLGDDGAYLMERALELGQETEGAFDVAIYPVMEEWGFTNGEYKVPTGEKLVELLELTDISNVIYDSDSREVSFQKEGMQIDFGGIAKGYTSSRVIDIYKEYGIESGMVNLGGNVQVLGMKTDGTPWRVAIQSPDTEGEMLGVIEASDEAVITSGGYERYFEEGGVSYHHIIDPKTGYPAENGLVSVSIVSEDGTLADGLSTSLFIMGLDQAEEYWRERSDQFDAIFFTDTDELYITEGIADRFTSDYDINIIEKEG